MALGFNRSLVVLTSDIPYPQDSIPIVNGGTGLAGAQLIVSLPGTPGLTTFLSQLIVSSDAPSNIHSAVATIFDGANTLPVYLVETVSAGGFVNVPFYRPVVAVAPNTPITVTIPAISGGAPTAITLLGYQR